MCPPEGVSVILRIEGKTKTIFEGQVTTTYHRVTTFSGGTRNCNGLNNDGNPCPGPTCTTALDNASKIAGFVFDGAYNEGLEEFFIHEIGGETPEGIAFWQDDQVLFAHANCSGNNRTKTYLRPYGPTSAVRGNVTLTVTDWRGVPVGSVPVKETAGRTNPERHRYEWEGDVRS